MPKKRKSAAVSHRAITLICSQSEQVQEEGFPDAPGSPEKGGNADGKLVEVEFARNQPESPPAMDPAEGPAPNSNSLCAKASSYHSGVSPSAVADRSFGFAQAVHERIRDALLRCEERYPMDSQQPVLYVVVRGSAVRWKEQLQALHREYFQSEEAFPMEVSEQAADDLLQRLVSAGLVAETVRITRPLWPPSAATFF